MHPRFARPPFRGRGFRPMPPHGPPPRYVEPGARPPRHSRPPFSPRGHPRPQWNCNPHSPNIMPNSPHFPPPGHTPGQPRPQHGQPRPQHGQPHPQHGQPSPQHGQPSPQHGQPSPQHGQPRPQHGQPSPQHAMMGHQPNHMPQHNRHMMEATDATSDHNGNHPNRKVNNSWSQNWPPNDEPHEQPRFGNRGQFHNGRGRGVPSDKRSFGGKHNDGPAQKKKKKQKEKAPAETCPFYCKVCDRGYNVDEMYQQHLSTHIKCNLDGCPYVAAEKLVTLHQETQHGNNMKGMAKKIWQLESKEDINNWILERKSKYPTKGNIQKKHQTRQDSVARGEVLETQTFGKFGRHNSDHRGRHRGRGRGRGRGGNHENQEKPTDTSQKPEQIPDKGTDVDPLSLVLKSPADLVDDQAETSAVCESEAGGALSSLAASYGDLSSSDDEGQVKQKPVSDNVTTNHRTSAVDLRVESAPKVEHQQNNSGQPRKSRTKHPKVNMRKKQLSLLEKLLAPDVRHERNVILQCVRHIVKQDFFGLRKCNSLQQNNGLVSNKTPCEKSSSSRNSEDNHMEQDNVNHG